MKARRIDKPEPGFFKTRLVKNGPYIAARIRRTCACTINGPRVHDWQPTCDRWTPILIADIDGEEVDVFRIWTGAEPITREMWAYYTKNRAWALMNDDSMPEAMAHKPVDLMTAPIPQF